MEVKVWIGDLAEYNNGDLVGEWFTLPMDLDEMLESVLKDGNEEWFLGDTDSEICVDGLSINQMNELAEKLETLNDNECEVLASILSEHTNNLEEAFEIIDDGDYMLFDNCSNMSDVAYQWYDETGQLAELEKHINTFYINFEAIGRDMEIEGTFYRIDSNTFIQILR